MDPITGILAGASLLGGIIQATGGKKQISPEWLRQHFGPQIVSDETLQLFNHILNSPAGQQAVAQAAQTGNTIENQINSNAAGAGFGPTGGAESGASVFSQAAAGSAANHAVQGVRSDLWNQSFNAAQQMVNDRMGTWAGLYANQGPTTQEKIGSALGGAAGVGLAAQQLAPQKQTPPTASQPAQPPVSLTPNTQPNLNMNSTPLASAEQPRGLATARRIPSRIDRFVGRSMSVIQPKLGPAADAQVA